MDSNSRLQIEQSYRRMGTEGRYRPYAPSDGMGHITVPLEETVVDDEAREYAIDWWQEENERTFMVGCCNFPTRPATIFAIEAARNLCAGSVGDATALRLLKMAVRELEIRDERKIR